MMMHMFFLLYISFNQMWAFNQFLELLDVLINLFLLLLFFWIKEDYDCQIIFSPWSVAGGVAVLDISSGVVCCSCWWMNSSSCPDIWTSSTCAISICWCKQQDMAPTSCPEVHHWHCSTSSVQLWCNRRWDTASTPSSLLYQRPWSSSQMVWMVQ